VERPAKPVNTGHAMPPWANAVIMIENVQPGEQPGELLIRQSVAPWQHVRQMGEDMVATELVLPANHLLRPVDLGAVAGSGYATGRGRRRCRVAIIPPGGEPVRAERAARGEIRRGHIVEYNGRVLAAQIESWGGIAAFWP